MPSENSYAQKDDVEGESVDVEKHQSTIKLQSGHRHSNPGYECAYGRARGCGSAELASELEFEPGLEPAPEALQPRSGPNPFRLRSRQIRGQLHDSAGSI